jgi:hypothetical protein
LYSAAVGVDERMTLVGLASDPHDEVNAENFFEDEKEKRM